MPKKKQEKEIIPGSRAYWFEMMKANTGLKGWQIVLISAVCFVLCFALMLLYVMR